MLVNGERIARIIGGRAVESGDRVFDSKYVFLLKGHILVIRRHPQRTVVENVLLCVVADHVVDYLVVRVVRVRIVGKIRLRFVNAPRRVVVDRMRRINTSVRVVIRIRLVREDIAKAVRSFSETVRGHAVIIIRMGGVYFRPHAVLELPADGIACDRLPPLVHVRICSILVVLHVLAEYHLA